MEYLPRPLRWPELHPYDRDLTAWYPFDDRSGATLYDRSGNKNHGLISGATWVSRPVSGALRFSGSNIVTVPTLDGYQTDRSSLTIMAWINYSQGQGSKMIAGWWYGQEAVIFTYDSALRTGFTIGGNAYDVISPLAYDDGRWHHVTGIFDSQDTSARVKLCVDANLVNSTAGAAGTLSGTDGCSIGNLIPNKNYAFPGSIAGVRFYGPALSLSRIKRIYELERPLVRR
jgi:hypothetical protein